MLKKALITLSLLLVLTTSSAFVDAQVPNSWIGLYGTGLFPVGDCDEEADNGIGGSVQGGVFLNPNVLVKGMASYHGFGEETLALGGQYEGGYAPLEIGTNLYLGYPGGIRPYATMHTGWYIATGDFEESAWGVGAGFGIEAPIGISGAILHLEPNYNYVFADSDNLEDREYWSLNFGVSFTFWPPSPVSAPARQ